ncbi:DUF6480 family protein [Amycolatopsis sp. CA-230715]|uniref:DUF6480 family protein n=1 Tax=Amycolatopsis sp. CA-230715 TaxID=2745196 RepID=UPI001C03547A|nr:DUF6480 family protein [Amycolatopsis sp. CA-230715]QWF86058.1 hypothetical protein HUW46_09539 [Amycolatopsis sp. CA-230715]
MTTPPDPAPENTPGLERGGGVAPGDTPPDSAQTSGLSHSEPRPPKVTPIATIVIAVTLAVLVGALFVALGVLVLLR